jgi:hypothetical protein
VSADPRADVLVDVWVLSFPLEEFHRAQEHVDGLLRELTLIAQDRASGNAVDLPGRLLAIVDELSTQYAGMGSGPEAERDAAIDRGQTFVDLHYRVPASAAAATDHLARILDEADAYCRYGDHLLSLATPPESLAFRRWFLGEFVSQISGAAPTPWGRHQSESEWEDRRSTRTLDRGAGARRAKLVVTVATARIARPHVR